MTAAPLLTVAPLLAAAAAIAGGAEPLPAAFPPGGLPVLWEADFGQGYAGFAADPGSPGRLFTQGQTLAGGQAVVCVDAATGAVVWERRHSPAWRPAGLYPGPRSTPVALSDENGGGRVFFTAPDGTLGCLNADDGAIAWRFNLYERFAAEPVDFGYSCEPALADGRLYLPVGGEDAGMVCLDAATGRTLWHAGADAASHCPALPIELNGRPLVVGYFENALAAFDRNTGKQLWRLKLSEGYDEHAARPVYREPHLWISGPFRAGSRLLELTGDPPGIKTVWDQDVLSNDVCSSVLVGNALYGFDLFDVQAKPHRPSRGAFRSVDFLTGRVNWTVGAPKARRRSEPGAIGQATVLTDGERLLMLNDSGELILAAADPGEYRELGRTPLLPGAVVWTKPLLRGGALFARHQTRAIAVRLTAPPPGDVRESTPPADSRTTAELARPWDWTAAAMPAEPTYMMDAPTGDRLRVWFLAGLALLLAAAVPACGFACRFSRKEGTAFRDRFRWWHAAWAFALGAAGMTAAGHLADAFLFTWPVAVHAAFWPTAALASRAGGSRRDDVAAVAFVLLCGGYFLLCRRLGLAFEWTFLVGPPFAIPCVLLARRVRGGGKRAALAELGLNAGGFAASFAAAAAVLAWRY